MMGQRTAASQVMCITEPGASCLSQRHQRDTLSDFSKVFHNDF
jgi:hypothetical protein